MLKCTHCDKKYKYESERRRHQESHFPQFACTVCAKTFSFLSALRRHQKQHERKGVVRCDECGGNFRDNTLLKRHIQYAHAGTYCCEECSATFSSEQAVRSHSKIHKPKSERRYCCTFDGCTKSFNFPHHLKHHKLTHTNAKQHFCNVCGKGFIQAHHLKTHLKSHHPENWFCCSKRGCKKKFTTKYAWKKHMTIHSKCFEFINSTEIRIDSGISSDSNPANDIHEKNDLEDYFLCATCGELISRLLYSSHTLQCTTTPKEHFKCNELDDALLNYDYNLETRVSSNSTYHVTPGTYAHDEKVKGSEKSLNGFTEVKATSVLSKQNDTATMQIKERFDTRTDTVKVNGCVECTCSDDQSLLSSRSLDYCLPLKREALYKSKLNNHMPAIEYREDGIVKLRETFDTDLIIKEASEELKSKVKTESKALRHVPFNSCKAVLGNCIVSEDGSVGEGCLCARMAMDEQHMSAQEIEELTPNPNAVWV